MSKIQGVHIPADNKNLAINGNLDFWQRIEGTTATVNTATTTQQYTADMIKTTSQGGTVKNYSVAQSSNVPTVTQSGVLSNFSFLYTQITGILSPAATDIVAPWGYWMEGYDYERIHGKPVTFGFWVNASVAGTYGFALQNSAGTRNYPTSFVVSQANTWQFVSITITLDNVNGSWNFTNTAALLVYIGVYGGSNFAGTAGAWNGGTNSLIAPGLTAWQGTNGATLRIAQFSIMEGTLGAGPLGFQRNGKSLAQELTMCQRYYEKSYPQGQALQSTSSQGVLNRAFTNSTSLLARWAYPFSVPKRAGAAMSFWSTANGVAGYCIDNSGNSSAGLADGGDAFGYWLEVNPTVTTGTNHTIAWHFAADAGL